ncbi:dnaJ homolog subfamily C member 4 [Haemorhous mexicanus]|uniref:dnaJ homolog subfamily C member 4 n=1 Tax=Haemorhous mexicanus TaxID=30427 RepID=UPI0028BE395D|nr:dnaJ homolog subfamily C member 4 [Haemorhous mexicanus]
MAARRAVAMGPWAVPLPPRWRGLSTRPGPPDPHAVLGVRPGASPREIRTAFLARCKEVHPDGDPSDPSRHGRFLRLAEAYAALSAPRDRDPPRDTVPRPPAGPRWEQEWRQREENRRHREENRRYWEQFRPPCAAPRAPHRRLLGLLLLLMALGGLAHGLAYRYVAGAHTAFLDQQDRELRAAYERARSRAGSREELLKRLRERGRGRGAPR